jgi:aarF domain-containing kinase
MDYEVAKVKPYIFIFAEDVGKEEMEHKRLESEMELRERDLEEAQVEYAKDTSGKAAKLAPEERTILKLQQKQRMQEAASRLAEAEEQCTSMEGESAKSKLHRRAAHRLLQLCRENGGVYIKVGQHLANLDYLIPQEYIEVLSSLFDEAPQSDYKDVCRVIEEELGGKVNELFDKFDPVPIASASLAQVHVAYDKKTGKKLAVKVQHAGLRETSAGDLFAVTGVVGIIDSLFEDFSFGWIADEMVPNLPKELDFSREGKNAERAAAHMAESGLECIIPKIIWTKTAPRVLTMEFEEGFRATDIEAIEKSGLNKQ